MEASRNDVTPLNCSPHFVLALQVKWDRVNCMHVRFTDSLEKTLSPLRSTGKHGQRVLVSEEQQSKSWEGDFNDEKVLERLTFDLFFVAHSLTYILCSLEKRKRNVQIITVLALLSK